MQDTTVQGVAVHGDLVFTVIWGLSLLEHSYILAGVLLASMVVGAINLYLLQRTNDLNISMLNSIIFVLSVMLLIT